MDEELEKMLKEYKVMLGTHSERINRLKGDIKEIRTDVTWLKATYQEIKDIIDTKFSESNINYRHLDTKLWAIAIAAVTSLIILIGVLIKGI